MKALWFHVRNSPIRWVLPVLVVIDLAVLFLRDLHWIGVWPQTGAAAQVPAYLIGAVAAGAAAWAAGAPARHRLGEQLGPMRIRPAMAEGYRLGATVIIVLIPYLVGQAVAFVLTARTFPPGVHLYLGYLLLGVFVMLVAVAVGWACGLLLGPVFSALSAALGFLFLDAAAGRAGFVVVSGYPEVTVSPVVLALRLVLVVALLLVLLWLPGSVGVRPSGKKGLVAVVAALPLLAAVLSASPVTDRQPPGADVICLKGATTICIWPEDKKYVPQIRELNARIGLLPAVFVPPPRINEFGIEKVWFTTPEGTKQLDSARTPPYFYLLEGSAWSYAGDVGKAILNTTLGIQDFRHCDWRTIAEADQTRLWVMDKWIEAFLVGKGTPDYRTNAPDAMQVAWSKGREIARRPRADQLHWAEQEVNDLRGHYCQSGR